MRKMMTKEVTKTTVQVAKMEVENGLPVAKPLDDVIIMGNVDLERAQKVVNKKYDFPVTVFNVSAETEIYEMPVEDFIKVATIKKEEVASEETTTQENN